MGRLPENVSDAIVNVEQVLALVPAQDMAVMTAMLPISTIRFALMVQGIPGEQFLAGSESVEEVVRILTTSSELELARLKELGRNCSIATTIQQMAVDMVTAIRKGEDAGDGDTPRVKEAIKIFNSLLERAGY